METKKFKIQKAERTKGGFNNTRTVLTGAGIAAIGGGAAGAGYAAMTGGKNEPIEPKPEEQNTQTTTETTEEQQVQQQTSFQTPQQQQTSSDEYQPTGGGGQQASSSQSTNNAGSTNEDVDPNVIAQELKDEIDREDIDAPSLIVDEYQTIYGPDGNEMAVAVVHAPDGTQFFLTDLDGDGIFSEVYDLAGNYIGEAEGNITISDLEEMIDTTGGYMAIGKEPEGDDPVAAITNTDGGKPVNDTPDMAQQTSSSILLVAEETEEGISDQELLAQLEKDLTDDDDETTNDRIVEDSEELEDETEDDEEDYDVTDNDGEYEYEG